MHMPRSGISLTHGSCAKCQQSARSGYNEPVSVRVVKGEESPFEVDAGSAEVQESCDLSAAGLDHVTRSALTAD